jgi:hypothetical protein
MPRRPAVEKERRAFLGHTIIQGVTRSRTSFTHDDVVVEQRAPGEGDEGLCLGGEDALYS